MGAASKPIEKVDAASGAVVASFPSLEAAAQEAGAKAGTLQARIRNRSEVGGHFWRAAAEEGGPAAAGGAGGGGGTMAAASKPVEKVDAASGAVVATFPSVEAAAQEAGAKIGTLRARISRSTSVDGHTWRFASEAAAGAGAAGGAAAERGAARAPAAAPAPLTRVSREEVSSAAEAPPTKKRRNTKGSGSLDEGLPSGREGGPQADILSGLDSFQLTAAATEVPKKGVLDAGEKQKAPAPVAARSEKPRAAVLDAVLQAMQDDDTPGTPVSREEPSGGALKRTPPCLAAASAKPASSPPSTAKLPQPAAAAAAAPAGRRPAGPRPAAQAHSTFESALESLNTLKFAGPPQAYAAAASPPL